MRGNVVHLSIFISAATYSSLLHRIAAISDAALRLRRLRTVHAHITTAGFKPRAHILNKIIDIYSKTDRIQDAKVIFENSANPHDAFAATSLITAYSAAGCIELARQMFDKMPINARDTVFYNSMISGYSKASEFYSAIAIYRDMIDNGVRKDNYTLTSLLSAASAIFPLIIEQCWQLHCVMVKSRMGDFVSVNNALIALYMKCENVEALVSARKVFDLMPEKDELTWTTMVVGYVRRDEIVEARRVFDEMEGRFDVVWNAMISGFVHHGFVQEALEMFRQMHLSCIPLDEFTYTSVLSVCANAGLFNHGKAVHAHIIRAGPEFNSESALPVENVLITLYSKHGKLMVARRVFNDIRKKDVVSWNAILTGYMNSGEIDNATEIFRTMPHKNQLALMVMISGFLHSGLPEEAVKLFNQMRREGVKPCDYSYASTIAACGDLGALQHGRQLHAHLVQIGYESSISVGNSLLTMYAKCGSMEEARLTFLVMPNVDSVSWNAMVAALGHHGHGIEAIELFDQMLRDDIAPDRISFLTVLSACSHAGLLDEGNKYFYMMEHDYNISPGEDHYARLIDLYSRAGRISEAMDIIKSMPFNPGKFIWEAVLSGCRIHKNMDLGIYAGEQLLEMAPQHDGTYVLLCNMYAVVGQWEDAARVRKLMKDRGVKKEPGCSWIEVGNKVHVFVVNDLMHPEIEEIYKFLLVLGAKIRKLGYVPDTNSVLHDVDDGRKEYSLAAHSEKLAVAYGFLKLPTGATVTVLKNLRICGDCHSAIMFMSIAANREIVVRDGKRFHHFKNGECSCGNYW